MSEKILIASGKGGVGKSTVATYLAGAEASKGKKVLLIDSDTGLGALDIMTGVSDRVMNTWLDIETGDCNASNAIIGVGENVSLIPSPTYYPDSIPEDVFVKICSEVENNYDIIFIDSAAGIDDNLKRAAKACNKAVFVATADEISIRCASAAADKTETMGIAREDMRLVVNRFVLKEARKNNLLNVDGAIDKSGVMLLGIVPEDKKIIGSSVTEVKPGKNSKFCKAFDRIADRINGKNIPLKMKEI